MVNLIYKRIIGTSEKVVDEYYKNYIKKHIVIKRLFKYLQIDIDRRK